MRHGPIAALCAVAAFCAAAPAAAAITFKGDYDVGLSGADPGLNVFYAPIAADVDGLDFTLAVGETKTIELFTLYTTEASVNDDDLTPELITVAFDFTTPTGFGGVVGGTTQGQGAKFFGTYLLDRGTLTWAGEGKEIFGFGAGGFLQVDLDDATFNAGLVDLVPGAAKGAKIKARFTLISESAGGAVPEPQTWALLILGFGSAGAMLRRRRPAFAQNGM